MTTKTQQNSLPTTIELATHVLSDSSIGISNAEQEQTTESVAAQLETETTTDLQQMTLLTSTRSGKTVCNIFMKNEYGSKSNSSRSFLKISDSIGNR
jgi:hypothetical protein